MRGSQRSPEVMHRAVEELERSGQADKAVGVGDRAPEFTLQATEGNEVSL